EPWSDLPEVTGPRPASSSRRCRCMRQGQEAPDRPAMLQEPFSSSTLLSRWHLTPAQPGARRGNARQRCPVSSHSITPGNRIKALIPFRSTAAFSRLRPASQARCAACGLVVLPGDGTHGGCDLAQRRLVQVELLHAVDQNRLAHLVIAPAGGNPLLRCPYRLFLAASGRRYEIECG